MQPTPPPTTLLNAPFRLNPFTPDLPPQICQNPLFRPFLKRFSPSSSFYSGRWNYDTTRKLWYLLVCNCWLKLTKVLYLQVYPTNFEIFLIFSKFLRLWVWNRTRDSFLTKVFIEFCSQAIISWRFVVC